MCWGERREGKRDEGMISPRTLMARERVPGLMLWCEMRRRLSRTCSASHVRRAAL